MIKNLTALFLLNFNIQALELKVEGLPNIFTNFLNEVGNHNIIQEQEIPELNNLLSQTSRSHEEIEKYLIKNIVSLGSSNPKKLNILDQKLFDLLKSKIEDIPDSRVFTKFIYSSILVDLRSLITDPEYKNFLQFQKYKSQSLESSTVKMRLKYSYISPWIRLLMEESQDDFYKKVDFYNLENLNLIKKLLSSFAKFENLKDFKVNNFISVVDPSLQKAKEELEALSFKISPDPSPNYTPPSKLPSNVTDWEPVDEEIIENGIPLTRDQLFPEPDPNYTPPKMLPEPVDKWQ